MTGHSSTARKAIAFFDGQNLFSAAKEAFLHRFARYDPRKLAQKICDDKGWKLEQVRFYTGLHERNKNRGLHEFWSRKLQTMRNDGVEVTTLRLHYRPRVLDLRDGTKFNAVVPMEKGVDVRMALDCVRLASLGEFDVALFFSQDQDFSEVANDLRRIAREQNRWIKMASAYPVSWRTNNDRGINDTDWIPFDEDMYGTCLDPNDYVTPRIVKK